MDSAITAPVPFAKRTVSVARAPSTTGAPRPNVTLSRRSSRRHEGPSRPGGGAVKSTPAASAGTTTCSSTAMPKSREPAFAR
jgi:hypothetical protein